MMFGLKDQFDYFECESCGSILIYEMPPDLARYYGSGYYSFKKDRPWLAYAKHAWAEYSYGKMNITGRLVASVLGVHQGVRAVAKAKVTKDSTILDVGCGSGELIALLDHLGFENLTGSDPFLSSDKETEGGSRLLKRQIQEVSGTYDLVMFNHSLEHIFDPHTEIAHAKLLLNAGGKISVRIPIAGNYAWRTYGPDWVALDAPRHLCIPSRAGLLLCATAHDLKLEQIYYESDEFMFWGSEQYKADIPLSSAASYSSSLLKRLLPSSRIRSYRRLANKLNLSEDSDAACVIFTSRT